MLRLLRRLKLIGESSVVTENIRRLRKRQQQQLSLLRPLQGQIDKTLLNKKIQELLLSPCEENFNTFATRCGRPEIRQLNGLADVCVERVFERGAHRCLPFSVKDHLKVDGMIETCGFADNLTPATVSSDVVQLLEREGCVAFAHSNVPQGLLGIQASNSVYGTALNPHNPSFISGGSSGGQAVLVSTKASAFGVGSDSGGSARIPAAFCGIFGYKPTGSKRVSIKGRVGPSGAEGFRIGDVDPSFGFLARHMDDLAWVCSKTIGKSASKDSPQLYGGEWDDSKYEAAKRKKMRVGYLYSNPQMKIAPGIINSIHETLDLLEKNNHTVVEFTFPKLAKFRDFFFQFIHHTGFINPVYKRMEGHQPSPQMEQFYDIKLYGNLLQRVINNQRKDEYLRHFYDLFLTKCTTMEFLRIHKEMDDLKKEFRKEWDRLGIDVLISPVVPFPAILPDTTEILVQQLTFCCIQNIMQLPAGVIPTRLTRAEETKYEPSTIYEVVAAESIRRSEGMPLSIQVSGQHMMDEECLGAMWQIQKLNGGYLQPKQNE